jgi:STE24 endopeptidase
MNSLVFSQEEVARAARYHRPKYLALLARFVLTVATLLALRTIGHDLDGAAWAGAAALWAVVVTVALALVSFPLDVWTGYVRERQWGFSTQTFGAWVVDQLKGLAVGVVLTTAAWVAVVGLAHWLPSWWVLPAAIGAAVVVLFLSFIAPVVLEPIFNTFEPLADEELAAALHAIAERAGAPVRDILVADASRRTTKVNAYVSGLGASRRVVLWDTLLAGEDGTGVGVVLAHELGHRRLRHVAKFSAVAMALAAAVVVLLRLVLGTPHADDLPVVMLLVLAAEAVIAPFFTALSRRYERQADAFAIEVTGDVPSFVRMMADLARKNLSDLAPPKLVYLFLFSHPTPRERVASARA